jgi:quercetin dioxygenase-like cupin family protein
VLRAVPAPGPAARNNPQHDSPTDKEDTMSWKTPLTALALGIALILVTGCDPEAQNAPRAEAEAGELAASAPTPPVTGEPAFTWTTHDPEVPWGDCPEWMPESCQLAVIQAVDEDGLNADAFFKLEPGTTVPVHWHTSTERMILLSGVMVVDYEGQAPVTVHPGTYAYGPAKLPHETRCLDEGNDDPCILFIAFEDAVDAHEGSPDPIPEGPEAFTVTTGDPGIAWGDCPEWMPGGCRLAVIQALDPTGHNADALFRLAPGTRVPQHWHTSAERMILLSGEMRVNYHGQTPTRMDPFTYAYGPAALAHDTRCGDAGECILFIAFEEPIDAIPLRGGDLPHGR